MEILTDKHAALRWVLCQLSEYLCDFAHDDCDTIGVGTKRWMSKLGVLRSRLLGEAHGSEFGELGGAVEDG